MLEAQEQQDEEDCLSQPLIHYCHGRALATGTVCDQLPSPQAAGKNSPAGLQSSTTLACARCCDCPAAPVARSFCSFVFFHCCARDCDQYDSVQYDSVQSFSVDLLCPLSFPTGPAAGVTGHAIRLLPSSDT